MGIEPMPETWGNAVIKTRTDYAVFESVPQPFECPSPSSNPESVKLWNICDDLADWESSKIVS